MKVSSSYFTRALLAVMLMLGWSIVIAEPKPSDLSVKGRAAPHSGIENMGTYCIQQTDAEESAHLYKQYPGVEGIIESTLDANLTGKGFTAASGDQCEIEMRYGVALHEQHQLSSKPVHKSESKSERSKDTRIDVGGRLRMGKVELNAFDKKTNRHIWKGEAANVKGVYIDLEKTDNIDMDGVRVRIEDGFRRLFKRFPARAGS